MDEQVTPNSDSNAASPSTSSTGQANNGLTSGRDGDQALTSNDLNTPTPVEKEKTIPDISPDQLNSLKQEIIEYAKRYAKTGANTRKEPASNLANDQGPFTWWQKQATLENNTWSVSYWEYDNDRWQLQATKVELHPDGHSQMTAYSVREDSDPSFPGFQIYKEQKDERYHAAAIEDIVYLNRILKSLTEQVS